MRCSPLPPVLPLRARAAELRGVLADRLDTLLPVAMREAGLDCWLVICQEDDYDPVFSTLLPFDSWCPILQLLVFLDRGGTVERYSLAMTNTGGLYQQPWNGRHEAEQWTQLRELLDAAQPQRIGINTGAIQWAAGGLTHNLHGQLVAALGPALAARLESAEPLVTRWLATLSDREVELFEHVVHVARRLLAHCLSDDVIVPGVTTTVDLEWHYRQTAADHGLEMSFKPFFNIFRSEAEQVVRDPADKVIQPGDMVHSDVGIRYLGLCSDQQQVAYIRRPGEAQAPAGLRHLMAEANRLQDIFLDSFELGLSGDELLARMLERAHAAQIPQPKIYSHSLGHFLHEPGPLIGLPWEQVSCPGRGAVRLCDNQAFTIELCVRGPVPEWHDQELTMPLEEDVVFTGGRCRLVDGRQTEFHLP